MSPPLEAESLERRFGSVDAVCGVTLRVEAGQVVGLLGPNGAGKTTTLRMLAGVLTPDAGCVRVNGIDMHARPLEAKPHVGFLSGDTQLYHRLSPREVLTYFGRLYGLDRDRLEQRITALIRDLDLGSFADRACGTLSSGQKQRTNIARAFLHEPRLLILDEPTTALDVISGQFIVEAIRRERARGTGVLFSTHIMGEAEYVCDRIAFLHAGRVVLEGTVPELLQATSRTNLTDAFLATVGSPGTAANPTMDVNAERG